MRVLTVCSMLLVGALFLACNDSQAPTEAIAVFSGKKADAPGQKKKASAALQFDGATQSTITPDADDLDLTTAFTIEMWIKPADAAGSLQHLLSKWGCCTEASYHLALTNEFGKDGGLQLGTRSGGLNSFLLSNTLLQDGVWQHVAATFDNGEGKLYINGLLDAVQAGMRVPQVSPTLVSLARQKSLDGFIGKYYNGLMDEVRVWSVARTAVEIAANMNVKLTGNEPGLVAYWPMDEGTGDLAADFTGKGHDMQLGNAAGADAGDPVWVSPGRL